MQHAQEYFDQDAEARPTPSPPLSLTTDGPLERLELGPATDSAQAEPSLFTKALIQILAGEYAEGFNRYGVGLDLSFVPMEVRVRDTSVFQKMFRVGYVLRLTGSTSTLLQRHLCYMRSVGADGIHKFRCCG